jgi:AcrR family transcriptional regulator
MRNRDPRKEKAIRLKAMEMAVREGFDGLSMQKIARSAKVSPGTLYIYFTDREDLILQVYREEMQKSFEATMENFDPAMRFDEGLRLQWLNSARYCLANPLPMQFLEQFRHTPLHEKALAMNSAGNAPLREKARAFLAGAISRGELVKVPMEVYWALSFAPMFQLVKFHLQGISMPGMGKFVLTEELLLQTLDLVLKSLKPVPGPDTAREDDEAARASESLEKNPTRTGVKPGTRRKKAR